MRHLASLLLVSGSLLAQAADSTASLYEVLNPTPGQRLLLQQHFDLLDPCCASANPLQLVVEPQERAALLAIAPTAKFLRKGRPYHEIELEAAVAAGVDVPDPGYHTVAEIEAAIDAQVALYPTRARKVNLSALPGGVTTHEGRPIYALKVSDNVGTDEDEPAIVIAAQHHARELNSPVMVLGAMQRILAGYGSDTALTNLVNGYELWFVPQVNPDGVNHVWTVSDLWRKNRRNNGSGSYGVDLNRNYPFLWGACGASTSPSSDTYSGPSAGSEPEVRAMRNFLDLMRPEIYLDFHSYGQQVLRTYAPCATTSATMDTFIERYVDDLRAPMTYGKRDPSASGEAPEDHYSSGGTLSFLVEVGTSFQPAYATTVTEEVRVWPGVRRAVTAWRPAVRGHVRSSLGSAPLDATITFTPNQFSHGEVTRSRGRDGRYGLWLPLGSWNVTFAAANHVSQTFPITVSTYDTPQNLDVVLTSASCARAIPDAITTGSLNVIPFGSSAPTTLTTVFAANNGGSTGGAVYFDVTPTENLFVCGVDVNTTLPAGTPISLDLYTCSGGHAGQENNPAAWLPRTVAHGIAAGPDLPSHLECNEPPLLGVTTYGVALVARNFGHRYTNGNGSNQTYTGASMTLACGSATNTPFSGAVNSPRVANVALRYRADTDAWTNQLYQTILRREQLAGAGTIDGLAFLAGATARQFHRELRIRMAHVPAGHTLSSTFAANLPSPVTVLHQWDYSWQHTADIWQEIGLTAGFAYDGVSDVVLEIFARGNHATTDAGFHRATTDQPRVYATGFGFGAVPAVASGSDLLGQRLRVGFHCASGSERGTACGTLRAGHTGSGARGTTFRFTVADAAPNSGALIALGFSNNAPFGQSLNAYGYLNCYAWNDIVATVFYPTDAAGAANHPILAPSSASFDGLHLYGQWYQLDASQPGGLTASNQVRWVLGTAP